MTDREKLVELLNKAHEAYYKVCDFSKGYMETLADHLLNNGVAFATDTNVGSKWISVEKCLPPSLIPVLVSVNRNVHEAFLTKADEWLCTLGDKLIYQRHGVTHWMPMPKPPLDTTTQAADL